MGSATFAPTVAKYIFGVRYRGSNPVAASCFATPGLPISARRAVPPSPAAIPRVFLFEVDKTHTPQQQKQWTNFSERFSQSSPGRTMFLTGCAKIARTPAGRGVVLSLNSWLTPDHMKAKVCRRIRAVVRNVGSFNRSLFSVFLTPYPTGFWHFLSEAIRIFVFGPPGLTHVSHVGERNRAFSFHVACGITTCNFFVI